MRAQLGTTVRTRDDKLLGPIEWLLVDPDTREVKSIGVRHGHFQDHAVKLPLKHVRVSREVDALIANIDEADTRRLAQGDLREETVMDDAEAVSAFSGGTVWPVDNIVPKPREPRSAPTHTEFDEMIHMADTDVIVLGEGSDVYSKSMHHVGEIAQIRFETHTGQLLSVEMKRGFLHHVEYELPKEFIAGVDEGAVYLNVELDDIKSHIREIDQRHVTA